MLLHLLTLERAFATDNSTVGTALWSLAQHPSVLIRDKTKENRLAQMIWPDIPVFAERPVVASIRSKYKFTRTARRFSNGQPVRKQIAKLYIRGQTPKLKKSSIQVAS